MTRPIDLSKPPRTASETAWHDGFTRGAAAVREAELNYQMRRYQEGRGEWLRVAFYEMKLREIEG